MIESVSFCAASVVLSFAAPKTVLPAYMKGAVKKHELCPMMLLRRQVKMDKERDGFPLTAIREVRIDCHGLQISWFPMTALLQPALVAQVAVLVTCCGEPQGVNCQLPWP